MHAAFVTLGRWGKELRRQSLVVYCIARDPRTPWGARLVALLVAAYALSPIDLIPDFIPVLGLLDDLVIVPLGVMLVLRMVPGVVLRDARARAGEMLERPVARGMALAIVAGWGIAIAACLTWAWTALGH